MHTKRQNTATRNPMTCKFHEVFEFVRDYNLLNDLSEEEIKENFDLFHHACAFDKELRASQIQCDDPNVFETVLAKILEILDEAFDHEYTLDMLRDIANNFCKVFEAAEAPKKPVPFIIVMISRI